MNSDDCLEINLLEKTELWLEGISLKDARLDDIAAEVAAALELEPREVLVVDVREDHIVLDILRPVLRMTQIAGKGEEILRRISRIPGVGLSENARLHSEGALGWVCLDPVESRESVKGSQRLAREIRKEAGSAVHRNSGPPTL